jgi:hypothetical protein
MDSQHGEEREYGVEEMVDRCGELTQQIAALEHERSYLKKLIVGAARFLGDSRTCRVPGLGFVAKVERKTEIKYDKEALGRVLELMGEDDFRKFFDWEYVPIAKKTEIDGLIRGHPHGALIAEARVAREMSPSVTFVRNEAE